MRSLSFAVGTYLPHSTTAPIFVGGMLKALMGKASGRTAEASEVTSEMLDSTGLVAGGYITAIAIALLAGIPITTTPG